ncbi:hypothetical protein B0H10DRAFT_1938611 [Mycena sp. CBHHK59/15]|nr:hypothetical protein B0H10DRAFT_1938611 [Mycena sp. CBHHK59/15]
MTTNTSVQDIPVVVSPFSTRDVSTSCYLHLHPSLISPDPKAEPRTDLLNYWIAAFDGTGWEVKWAPQIEGKDKRMWLHVADVFEGPTDDSTEGRKRNDKMMNQVRALFDAAGFQTVNGFKSGNGIIVTFALPRDVDRAANKHQVSFDGRHLPVFHVRQIEIEHAFELVIGGTAGIDPTAQHNIVGWFASFERDGETLLADTRSPPSERDHIRGALPQRTPQLLFRLNTSAAWKVNPNDAVIEGADKVTGAVAALTRRIETSERDSRARDADTKARLVTIDANVASVTNIAHSLANRQDDLGRGLFLLQQDTHISSALTRIDNLLMMSRQTYSCPLDDAEKEGARQDILRLNEERKALLAKLDALHSHQSAIAAPGPSIPPPPPATSPLPTPSSTPSAAPSLTPMSRTTPSSPPSAPPGITRHQPDDATLNPAPNPAKHARLSTDNTENDVTQYLISSENEVVQYLTPGPDDDIDMSAAPDAAPTICGHLHSPRCWLMAARRESEEHRVMTPSMCSQFTKGPDGSHGFCIRSCCCKHILYVRAKRKWSCALSQAPPHKQCYLGSQSPLVCP